MSFQCAPFCLCILEHQTERIFMHAQYPPVSKKADMHISTQQNFSMLCFYECCGDGIIHWVARGNEQRVRGPLRHSFQQRPSAGSCSGELRFICEITLWWPNCLHYCSFSIHFEGFPYHYGKSVPACTPLSLEVKHFLVSGSLGQKSVVPS